MSIKPLAAFSFTFVFIVGNIFSPAQSPSPSPTAAPVATPAASPAATPAPTPAAPAATQAPAVKPVTPAPVAEKKAAAPGMRAVIDGLSKEDLAEAVKQLQANYINPDSLSEQELSRATLQGLISRLAPGASIFSEAPAAPVESPFRSEILNDQIGYLRLGSLAKGNVDEMDAALQNFKAKDLKAVVLDLRATPAGSDFDQAAEVIKRFCPKGRLLFTVRKPSVKQARIVTSNQDPVYSGTIVVLADGDTSGAGEVVAAALKTYASAMVVGANTAGQSVEFSDITLPGGKILRVAIAEVVMPGDVSIFPKGIKPDIAVEVSKDVKQQIMDQSLDKGVSQFVYETERTHMNEAALVARKNPDIDAIEAAQKLKGTPAKAPLRDVVLQRAVDFITTIGVYGKPPEK